MNGSSKVKGVYSLPVVRESGFTLTELLIAMGMAAIVATTGFALFSASNDSYQTQESVGEAQQNARVGIDRISKDFRMAGYGRPKGTYNLTIGSATDNVTLNTPITVVDSSTGPDTVTILGIGYKVGNLDGSGSATGTKNDEGAPSLCYKFTTSNEKMFIGPGDTLSDARRHINVDGVFYAELIEGSGRVECGVENNGNQSYLLPLKTPALLKRAFPSGSVYVVQAVQYTIATDLDGCSDTYPCLVSKDFTGLRGNGRELLAQGISDMQFAFGFDGTPADGRIDDANADGKYDGDDFISAPASLNNALAVRISMVARTQNRDRTRTFTPPTVENHAAGASPHRHRVLTKVVKLRNLSE